MWDHRFCWVRVQLYTAFLIGNAAVTDAPRSSDWTLLVAKALSSSTLFETVKMSLVEKLGDKVWKILKDKYLWHYRAHIGLEYSYAFVDQTLPAVLDCPNHSPLPVYYRQGGR